MSQKMGIWTIEGRKARIGKTVTPEQLEKLRKKRQRQLRNLIERHEDNNTMMKKVNRWKNKIS